MHLSDCNSKVTADSATTLCTPCLNEWIFTGLEDCAQCLAGKMCAAGSTGGVDCKEGYYCPTGSNSDSAVICPLGHMCKLGSHQPTACGPGWLFLALLLHIITQYLLRLPQ